jgi:hypothetical protein
LTSVVVGGYVARVARKWRDLAWIGHLCRALVFRLTAQWLI